MGFLPVSPLAQRELSILERMEALTLTAERIATNVSCPLVHIVFPPLSLTQLSGGSQRIAQRNCLCQLFW